MSGNATGKVLAHGPRPEHVDRDGKKYGGRARGLRAVLLTVADAANHDGHHAHPGIANVAKGSLYGTRQASTLLAELVAENWLRVEDAGGGKGKATVYSLPWMIFCSDEAPLQPNHAVISCLEPESIPSNRDDQTVQSAIDTTQSVVDTVQREDCALTNPTSSNEEHATKASSTDVDVRAEPEILALCEQLADAIAVWRFETHGQEARPNVTQRWADDMRKMVQYGAADSKGNKSKAIPLERVRAAIVVIFSDLAEPSKSGFCWAKNVQSPGSLREHWWKIYADAALLKKGSVSRGARAVERFSREADVAEGRQSNGVGGARLVDDALLDAAFNKPKQLQQPTREIESRGA